MADKNIKSRIQLKHDTSANWALATTFVPLAGEMCIYTDIRKIKVGDGTTTIANLPFLDNVEGYLSSGVFYSDSEHTKVIPASTGVIYVELTENKLYRYSGSAYVVIGGTDILVSGILKGDGAGNISAAVAGTDYQAPLPTVVNDKYLHTNSSTGALEWSEVEAFPATASAGDAMVYDGTAWTKQSGYAYICPVDGYSTKKLIWNGVITGKTTAEITFTVDGSSKTKTICKVSDEVPDNINMVQYRWMNIVTTGGEYNVVNNNTSQSTESADLYYLYYKDDDSELLGVVIAMNDTTVGSVAVSKGTWFAYDGAETNYVYSFRTESSVTIDRDNLPGMIGASATEAGDFGMVPAPDAGDQAKFLRGDATWATVDLPNDMTGATSTTAGTHGLVPAPAAGAQDKFLKGDGTWAEVSTSDIIRGTHTIVSGEESSFTSPISISNVNRTVVYQNGVLLTYSTNYTISGNVITLVGYTAEVGDIFTVVTNGDAGAIAATNTYTEVFTGPGTYSEGLTTFTITHNLNSMAVLVQVYDSTGANVVCEVVRTSISAINLIFNGEVSSSQSFTVVVMSPSYKTIENAEQEEF